MASGAARRAWTNSRAKGGALLVLMAIAFECEKGDEVEMSVSELAGKARVSERTARAGVRELEALGELSVTPSKGARSRYEVIHTPAKSAGVTPAKSAGAAKSAGVEGAAESAGVKTDTSQVSPGGAAKSAGVEISDALSTSTGSKSVQVKETSAKPPPHPDRPDVERLCGHLADRIAADGSNRPAITKKWRDAARLLLDKDGITEPQAHAAIDWCQDHEFWRANILSMPKLREKYTTLRKQAARNGTPKPGQNENLSYIADYLKRNGAEI